MQVEGIVRVTVDCVNCKSRAYFLANCIVWTCVNGHQHHKITMLEADQMWSMIWTEPHVGPFEAVDVDWVDIAYAFPPLWLL